jgi:alpha-mannosidase
MYLERHRAVQTSQSRTKRNFRMSEHLIREAEYISTLASIQTAYAYPKQVR